MKLFKLIALTALLALLLVPAAVYAQEQAAPERGVIEFGFRGVTGTVYGRTDSGVPFSNNFRPDLVNSALNLYTDNRSGFYIPKVDTHLDSIFGSKSYLRIQSASNGFAFDGGAGLTRDQSVLVSVGQYGLYKLQFRFDETPHIFSGTTRTLYTSNGAGGWNSPQNLFGALCGGFKADGSCLISASNTTIANTLSSAAASALPFTQQENRKALTGSLNWNLNPNVNLFGFFSREHQVGTRPIGFITSVSSSGYASETPEIINYYTNTINVGADFGGKKWAGLVAYQGSIFQNDNPSMLVMNPFSAQSVFDRQALTGNQTAITAITTVGPTTARMDEYPDNRYHQFVGQGALEVGKYINLMASVTPGWMIQDANFQPLSTNPVANVAPAAGYPAYLPTSNLNGKVNTLAMNYTSVLKARKDLTITAKFQYYNYDNNTPDLLVRPIIADTQVIGANMFHGSTAGCYDPVRGLSTLNVTTGNTNYIYYCPAEQTSFTTKLFDLGGTWFFTKKNSVKFGFQRGWTDRVNSEVDETIEDTLYGAVDLHLRKDLLLRVSGRHQNRMPQGGADAYELDTGNVYARMPDLATRDRNRGDALLTWNAT
ncbi:MAG: MtrB/PioB family outer membrane beta-barrel protein, partial [Terriglobales bacterium]